MLMVVRERRSIISILNTSWEEFCDDLMIKLYNIESEHERYSGIVASLTKDPGFDDFMRECWSNRLDEYELRKEINEYWHECLTST